MEVPASRPAVVATALAALLSASVSGQPAPRLLKRSPDPRLVVFEMLTRPT